MDNSHICPNCGQWFYKRENKDGLYTYCWKCLQDEYESSTTIYDIDLEDYTNFSPGGTD